MKISEEAYAYWLYQIPGIGSKTIFELLKVFRTTHNIYEGTERELEKMLPPVKLQNLLKSRQETDVAENYQKLTGQNIHFFPMTSTKYLKKLRDIPDPPFALFVKGELPKPQVPTIALIGARRCSEYGRYVARQFGMQLARAGVQIVSGMASGIDGIGQQAALEAGGNTYGVLGCGVNVCYPPENKAIYQAMQKQGGVISEYLPYTEPKACFFPPRNRIISGLCDAVLVIEAKEKSGTLITVDMALEQGREVFALPGRVTDALSRGCNGLVKQGAGIVLSPQDLLQELQALREGSNALMPDCHEKEEPLLTENIAGTLPEQEKEVYIKLDFCPQSIERLHEALPHIAIPLLMNHLLQLCMRGVVVQVGGTQYARKQ